MTLTANRRDFLTASAVAGVVGFSSTARAWVGGGVSARTPFHRVPRLDGELLTDIATREELGQDLGYATFHTPAAVLRPGSVSDVVRMIRFCRAHRIKVAAKGQGHSTDGQTQVEAGLAIDMRSLATIHDISDGYAIVDAGSTWRNLVENTLPTGQTPPVLTGFIGLSIGGTLSMGGISGMAYKTGVQ
ncbi:MAG: FAD-binding protein, partial [Polyangiaceae bacterium]|nr:FAD-binding protein [Polyangiaceae bacterium]